MNLLFYQFCDLIPHSLKSVILVGVSNIVGVVQDNASPFNIADNLNVPYFTDQEQRHLLRKAYFYYGASTVATAFLDDKK